MKISERAQEILEKYWIDNKEENKKWKMEIVSADPVAEELVKEGFAKKNKNKMELTESGWSEAMNCVRRHRLAERLLSDVLYVKKQKVRELGCQFEHALLKDVEENICMLLGHPEECPHGKPIPPGDCCRDRKRKLRKVIIPLSECEAKERGKVAFIRADRTDVLNKLTAMGVLPGLSIRLIRKSPAYLFKMGESQFAIDKGLAEKILVRLSK